MVRPEGDGLAELWESVTGEHVWASGDPEADEAAAVAAGLDDDTLARWVPAATSGRYASMAEFRRDWADMSRFAGGQDALISMAANAGGGPPPAAPTAGADGAADVAADAPAAPSSGFGVPGTGKGG